MFQTILSLVLLYHLAKYFWRKMTARNGATTETPDLRALMGQVIPSLQRTPKTDRTAMKPVLPATPLKPIPRSTGGTLEASRAPQSGKPVRKSAEKQFEQL